MSSRNKIIQLVEQGQLKQDVPDFSPGDTVVMYETGHFAALWNKLALKLGLKTEVLGLPQGQNWRRGVQADLIEQRLNADTQHQIRAVCVVHNETSTGVTSDILAVRQAIDRAKHPALLLVDTISGVGAADYRHDEWGVDVSMGGSQKGLMMPPGIGLKMRKKSGHQVNCPGMIGIFRANNQSITNGNRDSQRKGPPI